MKFKHFICVGIVLGISLLGWYIARRQQVQSFLGRLRPPSVEKVKKWAGFPEGTHLTVFTNVPDQVYYYDDNVGYPGNFKWLRAYEDRKGSNFTCVVIAVYEPGALWPTNRAKFMHRLDRVYNEIHKVQAKEGKHQGIGAEEGEDFAREILPITVSNGQKSYGFLYGLFPARFAFHPKFDVLAYYDIEPRSYDRRYPPADLTAMATNNFSDFFTNVDAFLMGQ